MQESILQLIKVGYASVGIIALVGYWPTIKDLHLHKVKSANTNTYLIWTITGIMTFTYSAIILKDPIFMFVSGTSFIACIAVLLLSLKLKK